MANSKKKRYFRGDEPGNNVLQFIKRVPGSQGSESRRQTVLNNLFMRHITDMMASGEVSSELVGHSIEIVKVSVAKDFSVVNVYWAAEKVHGDIEIQSILDRSAGPLRSELIGLHILGIVPLINFVRDKSYAKFAEIEQLLATADFGSEHETSDPSNLFKSDTVLTKKAKVPLSTFEDEVENSPSIFVRDEIDSVHESKVACSEDQLSKDREQQEATIETNHGFSKARSSQHMTCPPDMRSDVFGLDRAFLMKQVIMNVQKSKARHRFASSEPVSLPVGSEIQPSLKGNFVVTNDELNTNRAQQFARFLKERQKQWRKAKCNAKSAAISKRDALMFGSAATEEYDGDQLDEEDDDLEDEFLFQEDEKKDH